MHGMAGLSPPRKEGAPMLAVIVTAVATFLVLLVMDYVDLGNFLVEGLIAVVIGAAAGLIVPWYTARQRRKARQG
jgi:hypothetical protein